MSKLNKLYDYADSIGVIIENAKTLEDNYKQAIHVLHPNLDQMEKALESAYKDGFRLIMCHSNITWFKRN